MAESWEDLPDVKADDWEKLPDVAAPPKGKVPSPTGWRDADAKPTFRDRMAGMDKEQEEMWSALASGAHGPAHAMEGPVSGVIEAMKVPPITAQGPSTWDDIMTAYRKGKVATEGAQKENLQRHPLAPVVGSVLSSPGSAPTLAGRLGLGTLEGGVYGLGSSKADLTKGEAAEAGMDTLKGAGIGGAGALFGELFRLPGKLFGDRAQKLSDTTHAAELAAEQEARAGAVASATGKEGGLTSSAMKMWDRLEDAMFNPAASEESKAAARAFINSDEGKALYNQVLANYLEQAPGKMGGLMAAKEASAAANAANDPALIQQAAGAAADAKLNDLGGVTGRLAEMARRYIPPAVGTAVGGLPGAATGAVIGSAMGKPGTIMSNMLKSPSMYRPFVGAAAGGIGTGDAMSKAALPLGEWTKFLGNDEEQPQ